MYTKKKNENWEGNSKVLLFVAIDRQWTSREIDNTFIFYDIDGEEKLFCDLLSV